ncbi:DUF3885 domain-containing protein [Nonomuraea fuscirosea]|uniref:DUF3885 domain-containing protein n=1 Tax=Nonomuraea fuscirosea TaxID=1291556 RepID=UPI003F4CB427
MHVHIGRHLWKPGILDPLLRAVADDECHGVLIMDTDLLRLYAPYAGGAMNSAALRPSGLPRRPYLKMAACRQAASTPSTKPRIASASAAGASIAT